MNSSMNWKIAIIILVLGFSVFMFYPPSEKINLGLDLKGGIHLRMQVMTESAVVTHTNQTIAQLKSFLNEKKIPFEAATREKPNQIILTGFSADFEKDIKDYLDDEFRDWNYAMGTGSCSITLKPNVEINMKDQAVSQALQTIQNRIDEFGVTEPIFQKEGNNRILIQLPGVNDKEKARILSLIKSTAVLEFKAVVGIYENEENALKENGGALSDDMEIVKSSPKNDHKGVYVLRTAPVFSGKDLKTARRAQDGYGAFIVSFTLNAQGANKIEKFSAANIGKPMAIVLDNRVISSPTIQGILSFNNQISGNFSLEEAEDLSLVLRSGSLPAELRTLEERTIGPSLGADSIRKGVFAAIFGLILVMIFMLVYYKGAGINSVIALVFNIVILLGILAYFKATLTVPGIAGIILTIGMAVDANVLVFERIKEDLKAGKAPKTAIDNGFKKAFVTIFDSNLTTVIAGIFLFQFGTGPIRGFSVTLIIGIIASMFTAVFVSRVIFDLVYGKKKSLKKLSI
jgi:preprotein translocase subunit SecD